MCILGLNIKLLRVVMLTVLILTVFLVLEGKTEEETTANVKMTSTTVETTTTTTTTTTTEMPDPRKKLCKGEMHSSNFLYTCCNQTMIRSNIQLGGKEGFKTCYEANPSATEESFHDSLWRFYDCLLKPAKKASQNDLVSFTKKMVDGFPATFKDQIKKLASEAVPLVPANGADMKRAVRSLYHQIEQQVCEGTYKEGNAFDPSLNCNSPSDLYRESYHARGGCCSSKTVPIRLEFFRYESTRQIRNCTKYLMYGIVGPNLYMDLDYDRSDAQQICHLGCTLQEFGLIEKNALMTPVKPGESFNVTKAVSKLSELFSDHEKNKSKFMSFFEFNGDANFTAMIKEDIQEPVTAIVLSEFYPNVNRTLVESVIFNCEAYNQLVRQFESWIYSVCYDDY